MPAHRRSIDEANAARLAEHDATLAAWTAARKAHDDAQAKAGALFRARGGGSPKDTADFLEWHLANLSWPRQTEVQFDLSDDGRMASFDIDLPEIEDLPKAADGSTVEMTEAHQRQIYVRHVHGVGLRIAGEAFANAPTVQLVTVSGYSQRVDPHTGERVDEYLLSAKISRARWELIDFEHFAHLDPVALFDRFETRRSLTPTGDLRPIDPF